MQSFDVVIVGAGLSGIGAAYCLQTRCPNRSYAILEGREALGGTWDLFRYPGIRSDSDMHTLGYSFKPWIHDKAIADGPSILNYLKETATENGIDRHIRYGVRVKRVTWSTEQAAWTVEAVQNGAAVSFRCNFLWLCAGYFSYESGYTPDFPGKASFRGQIVHPQEWPEALDVRGKRVVVIGSGATAATLVPELAKEAEHVVMLQRSPTYFLSAPDVDPIAKALRKVLPERTAYAMVRWKNVRLQRLVFRLSRRRPRMMKRFFVGLARRALGKGYDVDTHFTPRYGPWEQRLCLVVNSDLFEAIRAGKVSVVTEPIAAFTETGITLPSGRELAADLVVTATGLNLEVYGGVEVVVDGRRVDVSSAFSYKGMMLQDVPNLATTFGYVNASWTLRADLTAEIVCRILNHMTLRGVRRCTPRLREEDRGMLARPWIEGFSSGYLERAQHRFPKQGDRHPWDNPQDYVKNRKQLLSEPVEDGVLQFDTALSEVSNRALSEAVEA